VRTRDQKVLETLDIIVDVGGVYDADKNRLDHHQKTFAEYWDPKSEKIGDIKLSSAGLVYRHFGREVIRNITKHVWGQDLNDT